MPSIVSVGTPPRRWAPRSLLLGATAALFALIAPLDDVSASGGISGRVTGPDGQPLAGVEVHAHAVLLSTFPRSMFNTFPETRTGFAAWTVTGDDGTYTLALEPSPPSRCQGSVGYYTLFFSPPRQTGFTPKRYRAADASSWLVVQEGKTLAGIDVRLGPPASAAGTVTLTGRDNFNSEYRYDLTVRNRSSDLLIADSLIIVLEKITNLAGEERAGGGRHLCRRTVDRRRYDRVRGTGRPGGGSGDQHDG